jgi:hypothetical protein
MADGCQGGIMKESWLGAFKFKGKIIGDIVSPAANEAEWGVLNE